MISRRKALKTLLFTGVLATSVRHTPFLSAAPPEIEKKDSTEDPFKLPGLPYPTDALEPYIDAQTMQIHHLKHHASYVQNLNKALKDYPSLQQKSLEDLLRNLESLPDGIRATIRNQGGGHFNHSLFWTILKKGNGTPPQGELGKAIDQTFGSFSEFQTEFTKAASTVFGSGWAWLSLTSDRKLQIESTANQDNPLMQGRIPLLGIDVWEHAYYLKYQNRRPEYIQAFYNVIDWDKVSQNLKRNINAP